MIRVRNLPLTGIVRPLPLLPSLEVTIVCYYGIGQQRRGRGSPSPYALSQRCTLRQNERSWYVLLHYYLHFSLLIYSHRS